jgi:hypothetical protein
LEVPTATAADIKEKVKEHTSWKFSKFCQMINDKFDWQEKVMRNNQDVSGFIPSHRLAFIPLSSRTLIGLSCG